jgi:hypothetical protein
VAGLKGGAMEDCSISMSTNLAGGSYSDIQEFFTGVSVLLFL